MASVPMDMPGAVRGVVLFVLWQALWDALKPASVTQAGVAGIQCLLFCSAMNEDLFK